MNGVVGFLLEAVGIAGMFLLLIAPHEAGHFAFAKLFKVRNFGIDRRTSDRAIECLKRLSARPKAQMQISAYAYCPVGMSGVCSISHELVEQSEAPIDVAR